VSTQRNRVGKTGYRGVTWNRRRKRWTARLYFSDRVDYLYLGQYIEVKDAALAYNKAAAKHFGESAKLNDLGSSP
jgi:hypothetical protein